MGPDLETRLMWRLSGLGLSLALLLWFSFGQDGSAAALSQRTVDLVDSRPAHTILLVGNSRTYFNHMPSMIREIADSAGSPTKYQIEVSALPGYTFEKHWSEGRTRRLLNAGWDDVILQAASVEQWNPETEAKFIEFGTKLAGAARVNGERPRLVVNWAYDTSMYEREFEGEGSEARAYYLERIRASHSDLAAKTNMSRINMVGLWESVRHSQPAIKLTTDGNHPTVAGSYLYALAIYSSLSNGRVAGVTYAPDGVKPEDAKALREAVDAYPLSS